MTPPLAFSLRLSRSTDDSSSLAVQQRACEARARAAGFSDEAIEAAGRHAYVDDGVSGGSTLESRSGMRQLMADRPAVVIAWKLDRFARSVREFQRLMDWADGHGVRLLTADGMLDSADTSGTGRLIATIIAAVAQWELGMITDRSTAAHAERRAQGRWISGAAPWPYEIQRVAPGAPAYLGLPAASAALCREAVAALLAGGTLSSTAVPLPIGRHRWQRLLRGPVLLGFREHGGSIVVEDDGYSPVRFGPEVIDAATHVQVLARLAALARGEVAQRSGSPWLAGAVWCHRGCETAGGLSGKGVRLYKCRAGHVSIKAADVDQAAEEAFLRRYGADPLTAVTYTGGVDHSGRLAELEAARERIVEALAMVGGPALATLAERLAACEAEFDRLSGEHDPEQREVICDTGTTIGAVWDDLPREQQAELMTRQGLRVTVRPRDKRRIAVTWVTSSGNGSVTDRSLEGDAPVSAERAEAASTS